MSLAESLAPALPPLLTGEGARCKICGGPTAWFGEVSFLRATGRPDPGGAPPVRYQRCIDCGLLFTNAFDRWSPEDFQAHVYNDGYVEIDPDYVEIRPTNTARTLTGEFGHARGEIRLLDYGGGSGLMAQRMREVGFNCEVYDPFSETFRARPQGCFNLITCVEAVEHMPNPMETLSDLVQFTDQQALIFFTTLVQPGDIQTQGADWWYVGPRNGHITMHTRRSLAFMWARLGFNCISLTAGAHLAFRDPPGFARRLVEGVLQRARA